ncbi:MAG: hypothetical protein H0U42_03510 [Thermoleophilaceae bacterium]|nr:hypothetical protein [Thermoleophilaceae bacterium]
MNLRPVPAETRAGLMTLSTLLFVGAFAVVLLSAIGAVFILTTSIAIPLFQELQEANRGIAAVLAIGGGLTAASVMAGIGGILRILLAVAPTDDQQ